MISVIVCAAVMVFVALRSLDRQRQLFFTNARWGHWRGGPKRADTADDHLRHMLSLARDLRARVTAGRRARGLHPARVSKDMLQDWVIRRFRREHAARVVLRAMSAGGSVAPPEAGLPAAEVAPPPAVGLPVVSTESTELQSDREAALQPSIDTLIVTASAAGEGIVRVDAGGHLKFPDAVARDLLHWTSGERTLSDILVGGGGEAAALLELVARQEVVEQNLTVLTGGASQQLHVTALASRSRDGSLWGALLILRRP